MIDSYFQFHNYYIEIKEYETSGDSRGGGYVSRMEKIKNTLSLGGNTRWKDTARDTSFMWEYNIKDFYRNNT